MGIITEKLDTEDVIKEDEMENLQNGKFYMGNRPIHWSLNFLSETITLDITNRPDLGTKVINRENSIAEFRDDEPWYRKFYAKLSGDFNSKQLSLSGKVNMGIPRGWYTRTYENVIITSW